MNIRETLLLDRSKETWQRVAQYVGNSSELFAELIELFLSDDPYFNVRAGQTMSYCTDKYPYLVEPYYERLLTHLKQPNLHPSVKRNIMRVLQNVDIPEKLLGLAADLAFSYLDDINEAIAVRAFSIPVCYNICVKEPELTHELKAILEYHVPHGSSGFKNRGKKFLVKLQKLEKL